MQRTRLISALILAAAATGCAGMPLAQNADGTSDGFDEVSVTLSTWFPEADASVTADGTKTRMKTSLSDAYDVGEVAFSGRVEMWEGDWGYIIESTYLDMSGDLSVGSGRLDTHVRDDTIDFLVAQRYAITEATDEKPAATAVLSGGMRYRRLDQRVAASPVFSGSESHDWIEPVIGAGLTLPTSDEFAFSVRGDMSGFDVGSASHRTWNAFAGGAVSLDVSNTITFGWRIYDIDQSRGSGAGKSGLDGSFSGPMVGWNFGF
ncbi:MAG: hypothetical protein DRQ55_13000 [Planctomycetota bacterium]|nr:MAG: hypothetical protein DRQ55_13000 [Planctomycetota bacterium]